MRRLGSCIAGALALAGASMLLDSCVRPRPAHVTSLPTPPPPAPPPGRVAELRGVWVSDTTRLGWDSTTASLRRAGFNTMYVNLASGGAAFYPDSKVLPSIVNSPSDLVAKGIDLAHRRGLAVHAKQIVMFLYKAPAEFQRQMLAADRVMRGPDMRPIMQTGYLWLCPSQAANRALIASSVSEIVTKYPVDGIQFDYIRFSEQPSCYCANCRREFERSVGVHFRHWPADVLEGRYAEKFNEWRKGVITGWVEELSAVARRARPGLAVSAAVFPDLQRARNEKAQDWKLWLDRGYLDYVCTMTYTPDLREFETEIQKQQIWATQRNKVVVGIGSWKFDRFSQLVDEITMTRQLGAPGFVLFSYDDAEARNFLPDLSGSNRR
ncbi:MAG TPA: family 10 glycosylhydrolase [Verrucomicrobiae bacterium]|nr:family 10 glycosylhydrolase [Verrucomicrobiae bacterium]